MKAVKVQYTVQRDYAETNKQNISKVMSKLQEINNPGISYSAFIQDDDKTFVHIAMFTDQESNNVLVELAEFKDFQQQLKESQLEQPPRPEMLRLVASSKDIFAIV